MEQADLEILFTALEQCKAHNWDPENERLWVDGDLYVSGLGITSLPKHIVATGHVDIGYNNIAEPPESICAGGDIDMSFMELGRRPRHLACGGEISFFATNMTDWPEYLSALDGVDARESGISTMPENVTLKDGIFVADGDGRHFYVQGKICLPRDVDLTHEHPPEQLRNTIAAFNAAGLGAKAAVYLQELKAA